MEWVNKLTDAEVAVLCYAVERFADEVRGEDAKQRLTDATDKLYNAIQKEYRERHLHWSDYFKE